MEWATDKPTNSFWLEDAEYQNFSSTEKLPNTANIVIIGGGLTGISVAYWLVKNGVKGIVLVESRGISSGATGRNGGHLRFHPPLNGVGTADYQAINRFAVNTIKSVKDVLTQHKIECEYRVTGAVTLAESQEDAQKLKEFVPWFNDTQLDHTRVSPLVFWDEDTCLKKLPNFNPHYFKGAIYQDDAAQIWPAKFVFGITKWLISQGTDIINVQTQTVVQSVQNSYTSPIQVNTSKGIISTQQVVYATNGYTSLLLPSLASTLYPVRAQIVESQPLPIAFPLAISSENVYVIQRANGSLILGGMRRKSPNKEIGITSDAEIQPNVSEALHGFMKDVMKIPENLRKPRREWTGIMGFTSDGWPIVGQLPVRGKGKEWICAGFNGSGMTKCFGVGKRTAELITGVKKEGDDEEINSWSVKRFQDMFTQKSNL